MKSFILVRNGQKKELDIIETFGLSRSGKSTFLSKLENKGKKIFHQNQGADFKKFLLALKFIVKNPSKFFYIFFKLNTNWAKARINPLDYIRFFILRNSYLFAVLSKYESLIASPDLLNSNEEILIEECIAQLLLMIFHEKSSEKEIKKMMRILPLPSKILLIESDKKTRYSRISKTRFPGEQVNKKYAEIWMKNSEYNYKIIKKILFEIYKQKIFK